MRRRFPTLLFVVSLSMLIPATPARAQRGQLIEDLFRTISEAQLEREQRKRMEAAEKATQPPVVVPPKRPQQVPVPQTGIFPAPNLDRRGAAPSINVRSREAAEFAQHLVNFNGAIAPMLHDLRRGASGNAEIRGLLPEAYQVASDTRALIQGCDGLSSLDRVTPAYSELDARWRQLSFRLRSLEGLSDQCTTSIRSCDQLVGKMSRQLQIQPQFDRHQLHDLMVVATTYMQTLMDDLELVRIPHQDVDRLMHDCRLLRQHLLAEADRVGETSYEEVVTRFTDFVSRWGTFSEKVYAINDPHLQRRLDRIRECGDQTYGLLWMPPPYNASTLTASAQRLRSSCAEILDQLTIRSMVSLRPQEQTRLLEASYRMHQASQELSEATARGASRSQLRDQFARIDEDWSYLRPTFQGISSLNRATLASIDHECQHMRGALGSSPSGAAPVLHDELIQAAAALEGSSEYLVADLQRYERYLQPASYRKSITEATQEFHHHAKQLHAELSRRADLKTLQREAEHMLDGWEQLSKDLSHIDGHGLSERRAQSLQRAHQELVPLVAKIAAALVQR